VRGHMCIPSHLTGGYLFGKGGMNCRNCGLQQHTGRCEVALKAELERLRNQTQVQCNHCVTKDEEIKRLRNQVEELSHDVNRHLEIVSREVSKPKRHRAEYMREYRRRDHRRVD
jgi:hypothetical protein